MNQLSFPQKLSYFLDDILLLAGCLCILYGLSLWNIVITWIVGGLMLIAFGALMGVSNAKARTAQEVPHAVAD